MTCKTPLNQELTSRVGQCFVVVVNCVQRYTYPNVSVTMVSNSIDPLDLIEFCVVDLLRRLLPAHTISKKRKGTPRDFPDTTEANILFPKRETRSAYWKCW